MTDRRRFSRFIVLAPVDAYARTVSDCVVETWDGDHAVVVTAHAAARGESLVMQLAAPSGEPTSYAVQVVSSTPDVGSDPMRFRLHVTGASAPADGAEPTR